MPTDLVARTLVAVTQGPDGIGGIMPLYFADDKDQTVSVQVKKGLADAFNEFDGYQLPK